MIKSNFFAVHAVIMQQLENVITDKLYLTQIQLVQHNILFGNIQCRL